MTTTKFLLTLIAFKSVIGKVQTIKTSGQLIDYEAKIPAYCGYQTEYGVLKVKLDKNILKPGELSTEKLPLTENQKIRSVYPQKLMGYCGEKRLLKRPAGATFALSVTA